MNYYSNSALVINGVKIPFPVRNINPIIDSKVDIASVNPSSKKIVLADGSEVALTKQSMSAFDRIVKKEMGSSAFETANEHFKATIRKANAAAAVKKEHGSVYELVMALQSRIESLEKIRKR